MQVADPVTLYERPANAFVAGFIGMPEMNLAPAVLTTDGGVPKLTLGGQTIEIAEGLAHRSAAPDVPVTLGIRPQQLLLVPADTDGALSGAITNLEFMGHEIDLHARVGDADFVAVIPSEQFDKSLARGDRVGLRPIGSHVHLFDAETGENVSLAERQNS